MAITTSVAPTCARPALSERASTTASSAIRDLLAQATRPGMISLAGGLPDPSLFPRRHLAAIAAAAVADGTDDVLQYGATQGSDYARRQLGTLFGENVDGRHVVVTTGSQQALDLIARVMLDPTDQVVAGDPDYLGALQVFRNHGAEICPIAIDANGLDTAQLEDQLRWGLRPKFCYIVPHFHNPTGSTMSVERRVHLNELSSRYGFLVIEDDPYRALHYDDDAATDPVSEQELTVRLRSTSKVLAPGLRVGALHGPAWLVDAVVLAKQSADLHTSVLTQTIAAEALGAPWFKSHLADLRRSYSLKRDLLVQALRAGFGEEIEFVVPAGGMFIWANFSDVSDTAVWLQRCLDVGVCFVPGSAFAVSRNLASHARFSFATVAADDLSTGVERMVSAL